MTPTLALRYAQALRAHATAPPVPGWARQMEIFLHEDMGEYEAAKCCWAGCWPSGTVTTRMSWRSWSSG